MPKSSSIGKLWSRRVLSELNSRKSLRRVLDIGVGMGTYAAFREAGQHWIGVEVWAPYIEQFQLKSKYDELILQDARRIEWTALGELDLVICGDVLEHMTKDEALGVLEHALKHARVVLVSIPIVHSPQEESHGNPFEAHVKPDWSHEECLASLPDICLSQVEPPIGVYFMSRDRTTRGHIEDIVKELRKTPTDAASRVAQYRDAIAKAPQNLQLLIEFCFGCSADALDDVVDVLTWICGREDEPPHLRLHHFGLLAFFKEIQQRRNHGYPARNALSADDLHFRFTAPEVRRWQELCRALLERKPTSSGARKVFIQALAASNDIQSAEENLRILRDNGLREISTSTRFDRQFHDMLEDAAINPPDTLPSVRVHMEIPLDVNEIIFVAGDVRYFDLYGRDLVASFARQAETVALAVHIFDATDDELVTVAGHLAQFPGVRIGLSSEWTGLRAEAVTQEARVYYHAIRYVRLDELLRNRPAAAAWLVDMDSVFNGPSAVLFELLAGHDIALLFQPSRLELNNKIAAGIAGFSDRAAGRRYLRRVAGYILTYYRQNNLLWGIDQAALFAVFAALDLAAAQPTAAAIPPHIYDGTRGEDTLLWPAIRASQ